MPNAAVSRTEAEPEVRYLLLALALLLIRPLDGSAQAIRGSLVEAGSGAPVEGAAVLLLDEAGDRLAWVLTDAAGRYQFVLESGGRYRLSAERIGHAGATSDILEVQPGETLRYRMELAFEAITLAEIRVEGSRRCEIRPAEGVATARVWDEARKALDATAGTARNELYGFVLRRFRRELDRSARRVLEETSSVDRRTLSQPFRSRPAAELLEDGFVRRDGEDWIYDAPDAEVLLSDLFLDTHCMRLVEAEDGTDESIGLAFEPVGDRDVPDIEGTLWLDRSSGRLLSLEYQYVNLDTRISSDRLGGEMRFLGLPDGTWIVRQWSIRMPVFMTDFESTRGRGIEGRSTVEMTGIIEEGGSVERITDQQGRIVLERSAGSLTGVVLDSLRAAPAEGTFIRVESTGEEAITGADGRFRFGGLSDGVHRLSVLHPLLDSLGAEASSVEVEVQAGTITTAQFRAPFVDEAIEIACPRLATETGVVTGRVLGPLGARAGYTVRAIWPDFGRSALGQLTMREGGVELTTKSRGRFRICGVPWERPVTLTAVLPDGRSRTVEVSVNPDRPFVYSRIDVKAR
jgi:Carboxypeptidase regulatory-like domain